MLTFFDDTGVFGDLPEKSINPICTQLVRVTGKSNLLWLGT